MILADKIIELRKKNGWSQEELGEQLGVSRQAVSKWESLQTVPDINKIIIMGEVFGVSTDYLLKDEIEIAQREKSVEKSSDNPIDVRVVAIEEINEYLVIIEKVSKMIAGGIFLLCVSPIMAIVLYAVGESGCTVFSSYQGAMFGSIIQVLIITMVAIFFVISKIQLSKYSYLKKEKFETEYGVDGMIKEHIKKYENTYLLKTIIGVILCFVSVIPIMICTLLSRENDVAIAIGGSIMLIIIALGAYMIIETSFLWNRYKKLL